ncbi:MAG: SLBB domain-containing protein [Cytophagaceae bacterium]|nr:SLBB domain-containing protein [Cytophagaceae bacterium]
MKQVSDAQIESFIKEAESKGLSELQVEALAKANGYTNEDIIKIRERVNRLKAGTNNNAGSQNSVVREQLGEVSERAVVQIEAPIKDKKVLFGSDLFSSKNLNFEPNLRIPTPANYIIGPDDELSIDITGYAYQHYDLKVSAEGTVKLESLTPIYVNGLTVQKAKTKIEQRLKSLFAGLRNGTLEMDLTLGRVRSIKVTVVGDVKNPGTYNVSSLATLFNALYVSGGPSGMGSLRNIQLLRNNRVIQKLDLYEFLLKGTMNGNVNLMDQDVVFIPTLERKVTFQGQVKRPMIFELKADENLDEAIQFAGGFTEEAFTENIQIQRNNEKERVLLDVARKDYKTITLKNGDQIEINAILDRYTNKVEVLGAVFRPGQYALDSRLKTVKDLIMRAEGLREDAFRNRAILKRERENLDPEYISLDLNKILEGEDLMLKRQDVLIIKSTVELREMRKVSIQGAVNQPGEFDFVDSMSVNDLVLLAGGYREGATNKRIEIARRLYNDENNSETVQIISLDGSKDLSLSAKRTVLRPFDQLFIRELPNYQIQSIVNIEGEVNYPGNYVIQNRNERISDLVERAGGFRPEAYIFGARFYRAGKQVAVDLAKVMKNKNASINLFLEAGDKLVLPKEEQTVRVTGQVLNPTSVAYQPDFGIRDYISQAGGFSDSARVKKTYVKYANGYTGRTKYFLGIKDFPRVERGMVIIVPVKHRERLSKAEIISLSTGMVSMSAVLLTLIRLIPSTSTTK